MKYDGCGKSDYKGKNLTEHAGIFYFEGENKGRRVWMILLQTITWLF
jgi:hypothetical protein